MIDGTKSASKGPASTCERNAGNRLKQRMRLGWNDVCLARGSAGGGPGRRLRDSSGRAQWAAADGRSLTMPQDGEGGHASEGSMLIAGREERRRSGS